jgi:hypothetical protein
MTREEHERMSSAVRRTGISVDEAAEAMSGFARLLSRHPWLWTEFMIGLLVRRPRIGWLLKRSRPPRGV